MDRSTLGVPDPEMRERTTPATRAEQPRRSVTGVPAARVHQILGIIERHAAIPLSGFDVYVSVMGGIKLTEPAADVPIALAIASAATSASSEKSRFV